MPARRTTKGRRADDRRASDEQVPPYDEQVPPYDEQVPPYDEQVPPYDDEEAALDEGAYEEEDEEEVPADGIGGDEMAGDTGGHAGGAPSAPGEDGRGQRRTSRRLSAAGAADCGMRSIVGLTGKQPEGVTVVQPTENGWLIGIEVVEDARVPSSADILAIYEAGLDSAGTLLSYRRVRRYARGRGDSGCEER